MGKYLDYIKLRENLGSTPLGIRPETGPVASNEPISDLPSDNLPSDEELDDEVDDVENTEDDDGDEVIVCPSCGHTFAKAESESESESEEEDSEDDLDPVDAEDTPASPEPSDVQRLPREYGRFASNESFEMFEESVRKLIGGPACPDDWKVTDPGIDN